MVQEKTPPVACWLGRQRAAGPHPRNTPREPALVSSSPPPSGPRSGTSRIQGSPRVTRSFADQLRYTRGDLYGHLLVAGGAFETDDDLKAKKQTSSERRRLLSVVVVLIGSPPPARFAPNQTSRLRVETGRGRRVTPAEAGRAARQLRGVAPSRTVAREP